MQQTIDGRFCFCWVTLVFSSTSTANCFRRKSSVSLIRTAGAGILRETPPPCTGQASSCSSALAASALLTNLLVVNHAGVDSASSCWPKTRRGAFPVFQEKSTWMLEERSSTHTPGMGVGWDSVQPRIRPLTRPELLSHAGRRAGMSTSTSGVSTRSSSPGSQFIGESGEPSTTWPAPGVSRSDPPAPPFPPFKPGCERRSCAQVFVCAELTCCRYHPDSVLYPGAGADKGWHGAGVYPCCRKRVLRFDPTGTPKVQKHTLADFISLFSLWNKIKKCFLKSVFVYQF